MDKSDGNLFELVRNGDLASLDASLASGTAPDPRDDTGDTPLTVAAGQGVREMVDSLLAAGADINAVNHYGYDTLKSALWCNHVPLARHLLCCGAKPDLDAAAALGDLERLQRKWQTTSRIEDIIGAYLSACRTGQSEVIRWFLDHGMPVDLHPSGAEWGGIGCPGLQHAAVNGHIEVVQLLLKRGADLALVDDVHGSQALAWAASAGEETTASFLLEAGAELSHRNVYGLTAADLALDNGFEQLAKHLSCRSRE